MNGCNKASGLIELVAPRFPYYANCLCSCSGAMVKPESFVMLQTFMPIFNIQFLLCYPPHIPTAETIEEFSSGVSMRSWPYKEKFDSDHSRG